MWKENRREDDWIGTGYGVRGTGEKVPRCVISHGVFTRSDLVRTRPAVPLVVSWSLREGRRFAILSNHLTLGHGRFAVYDNLHFHQRTDWPELQDPRPFQQSRIHSSTPSRIRKLRIEFWLSGPRLCRLCDWRHLGHATSVPHLLVAPRPLYISNSYLPTYLDTELKAVDAGYVSK